MSDISRTFRWVALPFALSITASLAHAQINYAGDPTSLGTLSTTTPTSFMATGIPPDFTFNDYWTFTLPSGSSGGVGGVSGTNYYFSVTSGLTTTPIDLTVTIAGVTVSGPSDHFSFTGTPGTLYTMDISGTSGVGTVGAFYLGSIEAVPVPEPATWALMLAGIAAGARVARRRLS
jgi:PEP-CTERM motif-containing protein